jgi:hypothetical protein
LVILGIPGLGPSHEEIEQAQRQAPKPDELLRAIPWEFFAAGAIWIIGGNLIHLRQRRKAGESWLQALNPFAPFGRHMDRRSWLQLLLLAVVSLAVAQFGFVRNVPHQADDTATIRPQP